MSILDPIRGFGVTFGTMFRGVVTEDYPVNPAPTAPRYRMRHRLNRHPDGLEKCIGCELCAWACPADAIYVEGASNTPDARYSPGERYAKDYQINYLRCIGCGMCVEACPTRSLTMINEYELADDNRQDMIYTKDQLMSPLLPGMEEPPHEQRLGSEKDYYVNGPELLKEFNERNKAEGNLIPQPPALPPLGVATGDSAGRVLRSKPRSEGTS